MTISEHLMRAAQEDVRRAGERDRLLLEARRGRRERMARGRPAPGPALSALSALPASRLVRILLRRVTTQPSG